MSPQWIRGSAVRKGKKVSVTISMKGQILHPNPARVAIYKLGVYTTEIAFSIYKVLKSVVLNLGTMDGL